MRKRLFATVTLLSLLLSSCSALDDLLTFNISQQTSFTVESGLPISAPFEVPTPDVTTNSSSDFKNNKTRADLVKDVKLNQLKLSITNPSDQDFSFLKSVHIFISSEGNEETELAFLDDINSTSNSLSLTCTGSNLDKYIKADKYSLRTSITTRKVITKDVSVKADMKFRVTADPF